MNWPNEDLLLESVAHEARTFLFSAYAIDLAQGNTVKGKPIKSATITNYLRDAASLVASACGQDPRSNPAEKTMAPSIRAVLNECKRHEDMPHRVDPYTLEMHATVVAHNATCNAPSDSLDCALEDWYNLCSYLGCRLREYAQEDQYKHFHLGGELAPNGTKRAFTLADLRLFDTNSRPVTVSEFYSDFTRVSSALVKFSFQKNGDHGEDKLLTANIATPDRNPLKSLHNIVCRFARLVGFDQTTTPLAVYSDNGTKCFLHGSVIASSLRQLAKQTYSLSEADLRKHYKYSSHSLRAGAAVILHAAGVTAIQIKFLLRWRSDSFFFYLRNVAHLSAQQNNAFQQLTAASAQQIAAAQSASHTIPNVI